MASELAFVDSIANVPTTLLNLNDQVVFWLDTFDAPPPSLRRSTSSNMLVDGEQVSAGAYDNRTIEISWRLLGEADATAAGLQLLTRQLNAVGNLLRWKPDGATAPLFFRTIRSSISAVEERLNSQGLRTATVALLAEPFGYGTRQDLAPVTITADPATGTNRLSATLGTVIGDVDTPAYIYRAGAITVDVTRLLACEHGQAPSSPPAVQAESAAMAIADTTVVADAAASSGNVVRITFATSASHQTRIDTFRVPANEPGAYRLFARLKASSSTGRFTVQYDEDTGAATTVYGDLVTWSGESTAWTLVDLGLFQFPVGSSLQENGLTGALLGRDAELMGIFKAARTAGSGNLDVDFIVAVPAYGQLSFMAPLDSLGTCTTVWDGYADAAFAYNGTGTPWASPTIATALRLALSGGLPMLSPGVTNRLWYVDNLGPAAGIGPPAHSLTASTVLNVSYWPRYLYARPATS